MTSPQEILKASIIQLIDLWNETLSNDYMLHIEYTHYQEGSEVNLLIDHYLFGDVDWSNYDRARWHEQHTFHITATILDIKKLIESKPFFVPEKGV
jgi:hypothetical protein